MKRGGNYAEGKQLQRNDVSDHPVKCQFPLPKNGFRYRAILSKFTWKVNPIACTYQGEVLLLLDKHTYDCSERGLKS